MSCLGGIVVLGEALVDAFPDRDELGGAPFNVARNLAALGAVPRFVTRIGNDPAGGRITAQVARLGMDGNAVQRDQRSTGRVRVELDDGQPHFHIEADAAWDWLDADATASAVRSAHPALVYFGTLCQRSATSRDAIRAGLAASSASRLLDLNLREMQDQRQVAEASLRLANQAKVNDDELRALFGWFAPAADASSSAAVFELMAGFDLQRLVVTRGAEGWTCYEATPQRVLSGCAPTVAVADTVGAGDAFAAVLLIGELRGWSLQATLARAADFSAAVCTLHGAFDEGAAIYRDTLASWESPGPA